MRLNWRTSTLGGAILFHLDVCRKGCGGSEADIAVTSADLRQEQNIASKLVEATPLNSPPFKAMHTRTLKLL